MGHSPTHHQINKNPILPQSTSFSKRMQTKNTAFSLKAAAMEIRNNETTTSKRTTTKPISSKRSDENVVKVTGSTTSSSTTTTAATTKKFNNNNKSNNNDDDDNNHHKDNNQFEQSLQNDKFLKRNQHWIVLVDDEEAIRLAVGDFLYDQGYQVTACADADAFLDICQQSPSSSSTTQTNNPLQSVPDVIVSDVRMPGKDGLELLGLIRADERLCRVPVILLTAKGLTADRIAGYKAGANVYLPKPFAPEELLAILDNCILRRQQMTIHQKGSLMDLKQEMADIKAIMKRNSDKVVQRTDVYLTLAEREVLELVCKGLTNKEVAAQRGRSLLGVNRMIQKLYKQTQTETRTELVRWAIKTGHVSKR